MNTLSKIALASAVLLSMGTLTACQSTTSRPEQPPRHHFGHGKPPTPQQQAEQRAKFEQMQQACVGKNNGDVTQINVNNKTIAGKCFVDFRPTPPTGQPVPPTPQTPPTGQAVPPAANDQLPPPPPPSGNSSTPPMPPQAYAKQHHHMHDFNAFKNVCNGQPIGQQLKVTIKDQSILGTCELHFRPDHRMKDRDLPPPPPAVTTTVAPAAAS